MIDLPSGLLDVLIADCIERERDVPFMYRDASAKGWVTAGIGKKLNSAVEASRLVLPDGTSAWRVGDRPAKVSEISLEYVRVASLPPARLAAFFRSPTSPMLAPGFARDLCTRDLTEDFLPGLVGLVPDLFDRPSAVTRALLTIEYTTGLRGLKGFPHMLGSLNAGDYQGIVDRKEYHMGPPASDATNTRLAGWFAQAAGTAT